MGAEQTTVAVGYVRVATGSQRQREAGVYLQRHLRAPNMMDPTPFLEFNILNITEREADLVKPFTKENFNASIIQRHAEEVISLEKVTALVNELPRNPSENFIRFILSEQELVGGRVAANVVSRFEPIIKKSIQTALLGMRTKSIQQEIAPQPVSTTAMPPTPESVQARPADKADRQPQGRSHRHDRRRAGDLSGR